MRFTERLRCRAATLLALGVAACSPPSPPTPAPAGSAPVAAPDVPAAPRGRAHNWEDYKIQVGHRLIQANPDRVYLGPVPEPLLAIPVLEIELNADGSVRRIHVQRKPGQALDTVQLAIDAVRRAEPFGDVSHLPKPWKFSEVFLFNDGRLFKPRSLDR